MSFSELELLGDDAPAIYKNNKNEKEVKEEKMTDIIEVPVPFISGDENHGPLIITEDWYVEKRKEELADYSHNMKDIQIHMMQLIAERDRLKYKLGELNPGSKKDAKKIVSFNVKLRDIEAELTSYQQIYHINLDEVDKGSKLGRFIGRIKRTFKTAKKKVKKFVKRNKELISGLAAIILPVLITSLSTKLVGLLA